MSTCFVLYRLLQILLSNFFKFILDKIVQKYVLKDFGVIFVCYTIKICETSFSLIIGNWGIYIGGNTP